MTTIDKPKNIIPFLFMGCWNRDDNPRNKVAKAIIENPIKTLILGGDNIYPEKIRIGKNTDFTKVYSMKTLMNGINMLYGKEIYAVLGNHNIGGPMLNTQLTMKEWTMPDRYYSINFKDHSLIVIDSNLVTTPEYNTMRDWLKKQINILKSNSIKYFYIQHEPFIAFKKNKKVVLPNTTELLNILADYSPIAILCADTHHYQKGVLKINNISITQYIVGTGGADPDFVKANVGDEYTIDGISYTMEEYIPGYGYLEVSDKNMEFIKVEDWRGFEGKGGKRCNKLHSKTCKKQKISYRIKKSRKYNKYNK